MQYKQQQTKRTSLWLIMLITLLAIPTASYAQQHPRSANFQLISSAYPAGAGASSSSGYQSQGTVGEYALPHNTTTLRSANFRHQPGFLAAFSLPVNQEPNGDINNDGSINVLDLQILLNMLLHDTPADTELYPLDYWQRGELSGDGNWNIFDVQQLINLIIG
ncbi:MAG: dockerin type I domain-containing protein [Chloroflexota bacterium]